MTAQSQKSLKIYSLHLHQLPYKTRTFSQINTQLGSGNLVTGVKTIPQKTKSTSNNAQQEKNRSKEDNQIQSELGKRRDYERKS